jgi:hypothetical protein
VFSLSVFAQDEGNIPAMQGVKAGAAISINSNGLAPIPSFRLNPQAIQAKHTIAEPYPSLRWNIGLAYSIE